jgi:hypothetical protein
MDFGFDVRGEDNRGVLSACGADWTVRMVPAAAVLPDGTAVPVDGHRFVVAGDVPVGQVGSRYHPLQNAELLSFARRVATALGADITRAGVTQGRRRFWCHIPVGPAGLVVSTTHDGRGAVSAQMVVPVPGGLVRIGPEASSMLSFPHGPTLTARLDDPSEIAGWANAWSLRATGEIGRLEGTTVDETVFSASLEGVVPAARATTERKTANRHAVMDAVAARWVVGGRTGWHLLVAVAGHLDSGRRASRQDREDQTVDDSGWVTRAKFAAHGALSPGV